MRSTTSRWLVVGLGVLMRALGFLATAAWGGCAWRVFVCRRHRIMQVEIAMCLTQGIVGGSPEYMDSVCTCMYVYARGFHLALGSGGAEKVEIVTMLTRAIAIGSI